MEPDVEQHRLDRRLGDHHRPEHRLLCLQILGRDDRRLSVGGQLLLSRAGACPAYRPSLHSVWIRARRIPIRPDVELSPREPV